MKPIATWILLANARNANVLVNLGPGKGLAPLKGMSWQAPARPEFRDKAGVGHSIAGPSLAAVDDGDVQLEANKLFAKEIVQDLKRKHSSKTFHRLVIVSGPNMLGQLRAALGDQLRDVLVGEIPKDLSSLTLDSIQKHLGEIIAV